MSLEDQLAEHRKRWNLDFIPTRQFAELKNRLLTLLGREFRHDWVLMPPLDGQFAFVSGDPTPETVGRSTVTFEGTTVHARIAAAKDTVQLADILQRFLYAMDSARMDDEKIENVSGAVAYAFEFSPAVGITLGRSARDVTFYPAGAKLLDEGVINEPLKWLADYPGIAARFENALKIYLTGEKAKFRNLLDDLRFVLEQLLREILGNEKSLENQKDELLKWLREKGVHAQIANLFNSQLFGPFATYQNEAVKHAEEYSVKEIEFMIYLTGTYARMIIQLSRT